MVHALGPHTISWLSAVTDSSWTPQTQPASGSCNSQVTGDAKGVNHRQALVAANQAGLDNPDQLAARTRRGMFQTERLA